MGKTKGQLAYEEDCARRPTYDGGAPRLTWDELDGFIQADWDKNPTPREWPTHGSPERMPFNLNDRIWVKLTPFGRSIRPYAEDADGWSAWQAWDLMSSLGDHMFHGNPDPSPIEMNVLIEVKHATHGSPELDEDARKLEAMGQDAGPTLADIDLDPPEEVVRVRKMMGGLIDAAQLLLTVVEANQAAWEGEEDSVKEEHAHLIALNAKVLAAGKKLEGL